MYIFFDFEFTGLHQSTTPISLGMVDHHGNSLYAEFEDYDATQIDPWLAENILPNLMNQGDATRIGVGEYVRGTREAIVEYVDNFLRRWEHVTLIGDCLAYDWVLFCELFGGARNLPKHVSYIPIDLSTLLWSKNEDPDIDRLEYLDLEDVPFMRKHNALVDAYILRKCFEKVTSHT